MDTFYNLYDFRDFRFGAEKRKSNGYLCRCYKCGAKEPSVTLLAKPGIYKPTKTIAHICQNCYARLLEEYEINE